MAGPISTGATEMSVPSASWGSVITWQATVVGLNCWTFAINSQTHWNGHRLLSRKYDHGRKELFQLVTKLKKSTSATTGIASGSATDHELACAIDAGGVEERARNDHREDNPGDIDA